MTLLIAVGDESQLHQSSDYRLSRNGSPLSTSNGAKQLSIACSEWTAQLAFTGVAFDGNGYNTQDWLSEFLSSVSPPIVLDELADQLAARASERIGRVVGFDKRLTLVLAAAQAGMCRLFVISNWERVNDAPAHSTERAFRWWEVDLTFPRIIVSGLESEVPRAARRRLTRLVRDRAHPREIRGTLAAVNRAAAATRRGSSAISPECWVQSLLSDGQTAGTNEGGVPGSPPMIQLGFGDLNAIMKDAGIPGIHDRPVLRQTASYRGPTTPFPPPTGEEIDIPFASPTVSRPLRRAETEEPQAYLTIAGVTGSFRIRKNADAIVKLGVVRLELASTFVGIPPFTRRFLELPNPPLVDGASPRTWDYPFDIEWDGASYSVTMRMSSMAFRSVNHSSPLPHLGPLEELVIAAPHQMLVLNATSDSTVAEADLNARFTLREFPELLVYRRPI